MFSQFKHIFVTLMIVNMTLSECLDRRVITSLRHSNNPVKLTVISGRPASNGQLPYLVSIKERTHKVDLETLWVNLCGGTILAPLKVLTAAHCFEENRFFYTRHLDFLRVVAGDLANAIFHPVDESQPPPKTKRTGSRNAQWRNISRLVLHRNFHFPANDIALVFVDQPFKFNEFVDYINPAWLSDDYRRRCITAGYGRPSDASADPASLTLLVGNISVLTRWRCSMLWEMNMNSYICSDTVLADVSMGDSGGPLVCEVPVEGEDDTEALVVGVVSGKNHDKSTLFTRVSAYSDWLHKNSASYLYKYLHFWCITLCFMKYVF